MYNIYIYVCIIYIYVCIYPGTDDMESNPLSPKTRTSPGPRAVNPLALGPNGDRPVDRKKGSFWPEDLGITPPEI